MKDSGKYRVTHHLGRRPDSEDAEVIFSYPDEEPARRFYQRHLPPRVGYVLALWRPDGSLIASAFDLPTTRLQSARSADAADARPRDLRLLTRRADRSLMHRPRSLSDVAAALAAARRSR